MRPIHQLCAALATGVLVSSFAGSAPALAVAPSAGGDEARVTVDPQVHTELSTTGTTTFWVMLDQTADLSGAARIDDWAARGEFVMRRLRETAQRTQPAVIDRITAAGGAVEPFWIANALLVTGGSAALDAAVASRPVEEVVPESAWELPPVEPAPATTLQATEPVEWNVEMIGAPAAWEEFGARGQGVTVGVIDSGAQYDHPELVDSYRGNTGDGTFDHHYNWWDPNFICGTTRDDPCDNMGHGTHVTGTVVGGSGEGAAIGVAPEAQWIAAKGCETNTCTEYALLSSLQWMLAPTDRYGQNPRPELRPHIVNNSWSTSDGSFTGFRQAVQALAAAGTLPVFAAGNDGPGCGTVGAPGSYPEAYTVGSHDADGVIAGNSSRGASPIDGGTKPDISAPGVDVRSAFPGDGYAFGDGTSMAAPHATATAALMWSKAPALIGAVATTRLLLDSAAGDVDDTSCGGTPGDNNTYGEGRLDAYTAVATAPQAAGTVAGQVTDATDGSPIEGATVQVDLGDIVPTVRTGPQGRYQLPVSAGPATVSVSRFGYAPAEQVVEVVEGETTTVDLAMSPLATHTVSGRVVGGEGNGVGGAEVRVAEAPLPPVLSGPDGNFVLADVPSGEHRLVAAGSPCLTGATADVVVDGDVSVTLAVSAVRDARGYGCTQGTPELLPTDTVIPIEGNTAAYNLDLPFPFRLYGKATEEIRISIDGRIATNTTPLSEDALWDPPTPIPDSAVPNGSLYPYWADLYVDDQASIRTGVVGEAPDRAVVVEWRNVALRAGPNDAEHANRVTVQAVLGEDGTVRYQYAGLDTAAERGGGNSWTPVVVGIEDERGQTALQYSYGTASLSDDRTITFTGPPAGLVFGSVVDGNDGEPIHERREARLTVTNAAGEEITAVSVLPSGGFGVAIAPGEYTLTASAENYLAVERQVEVEEGAVLRGTEFALPTGRSEFDVSPLTFYVAPDGTASHEFPVRNVGTEPINVSAYIAGPRNAWLSLDGSQPPSWDPIGFPVAPGEQDSFSVDLDAAGLDQGTYTGAFRVFDDGGRYYNFRTIEVTLHVDERFGIEYHRAVDVGGDGITGTDGTEFGPDQRYSADGGWGYTSWLSRDRTSRRPIAGTGDDALYQSCRTGLGDVTYRFDDLPDGTYTLDLHFAETLGLPPGLRVFDVLANGEPVLVGMDIAALVGRDTALARTVTLEVTGGRLDLRLDGGQWWHFPLLCGLELTYRPELSL